MAAAAVASMVQAVGREADSQCGEARKHREELESALETVLEHAKNICKDRKELGDEATAQLLGQCKDNMRALINTHQPPSTTVS